MNMTSSAVLSPDGQYRYLLRRQWELNMTSMLFVMLNPSTADASFDDPTIRRCINFAKREGYGGLNVVNLFAYRATEPAAMRRAADPVGPDNDDHLVDAFDAAVFYGKQIVAGWGNHGGFRGRDQEVIALAATHGAKLWCFGQNRDGSPVHPLYQRDDAKLVEML